MRIAKVSNGKMNVNVKMRKALKFVLLESEFMLGFTMFSLAIVKGGERLEMSTFHPTIYYSFTVLRTNPTDIHTTPHIILLTTNSITLASFPKYSVSFGSHPTSSHPNNLASHFHSVPVSLPTSSHNL